MAMITPIMVYRRLIMTELMRQVGHVYPLTVYSRDTVQSEKGFLVITQDPSKLVACSFVYSWLNLMKIREIFEQFD